jgi:hypothetical protein
MEWPSSGKFARRGWVRWNGFGQLDGLRVLGSYNIIGLEFYENIYIDCSTLIIRVSELHGVINTRSFSSTIS